MIGCDRYSAKSCGTAVKKILLVPVHKKVTEWWVKIDLDMNSYDILGNKFFLG